jgi:mono/diheme cytochrome c family protein
MQISDCRLQISVMVRTLSEVRLLPGIRNKLGASASQSEICNLKSAITACLLIAICFLASACRRDMQDQPKMKPFRSSSFFGDGLSARQPVEGTIPRGYLRTDTALFTGKKNKNLTNISATASTTPAGPQPTANAPNGQNVYPDDIETFPFPISEDTVNRGRERYNIFCSVCHGKTGHGDGMIVRRGYRRAASFHDDRLRAAPVGHFFDAITNGWGAMPSYAPQIPVQDRWAIIAYIRALQLSNNIQTPGAAPVPSPTPANGGHK